MEVIMACRIGMTTNPDSRRKDWEREHKKITGWKILSTHRSKTAAQEAEKRLAKRHRCISYPGGSGAEKATWHVYKFNY